MDLLKRLLSAILSSSIIAVALGIFSFILGGQYDFSPMLFSIITLFYTIPIFTFIGIPFSLLVDWATKKILNKCHSSQKTYLIQLLMYSMFGVILLGILFSFDFIESGLIWYSPYGIIPAIVYFHILLLLKRNRNNSGIEGS
ncbi:MULTISPECIES: hypothetical protein [unclassified Bacillus (in: firmicutes)]|uniref:hypothetical protein n=1 Tax=unclassified Bacillus (in: firmicutes) TaxID=185979 RepID=UPI0008E9E0F0|nr:MULTISPECIES: hypothetical protein [unclassified Bacillus (in: firmicutes)]SFJ06315.1 hypothetical protein SAMN04488574_10664 [Bacillus sp. 71mf]SFS67960.1 hypothetical protein SAMN04488145_102395 [Bacillus sp. 103mf]